MTAKQVMCLLCFVLARGSVFQDKISVCAPRKSTYGLIGDDICNSSHLNNLLCDFDRNTEGKSDCRNECEMAGCDVNLLGNEVCDEACNLVACGYDMGDCAACAPGCTVEKLLNDVCDPECATFVCLFDLKRCRKCSESCFVEQIENMTCESECYNEECMFDYLACDTLCFAENFGDGICDIYCESIFEKDDCNKDFNRCAPECTYEMLNNNLCDDQCKTLGCNWDNFNCDECAPGCTQTLLTNNECDEACDNELCAWDGGKCDECAPGCDSGWQYDDECDEECNTESCGWDNGECLNVERCAPGCGFGWQYDNECDQVCNTESCGWDDGECDECVPGCYPSWQHNNVCDEECNTESCGWDDGKCDECAPGCNLDLHNNDECDEECNTESCGWDNGMCAECVPGCRTDMLGDEWCDEECNTESCGWDNGKCIPCSLGCVPGWEMNDVCEKDCYTEICDWDSGECGECSPDCASGMERNNECDKVCDTESCGWDNGMCLQCSPGCHPNMEKDSKCDEVCNTLLCAWDDGECDECAPGCLPGWQYDDECNEVCNTSSCNWDNGKCIDEAEQCAPGCKPGWQYDDECDQVCNTESCGWDDGKCVECAPGCKPGWQIDDECDEECNVESCAWDDGKCVECAPGCQPNWQIDDECDEECNVESCGWDNWICEECDPGCKPGWEKNEQCDEVCNTLWCDWDNGKCDECVLGCSYSLQTDDKCDEVCNVEPCDWDKGRCVECAPGCSYPLLHNDECDEECNTESCAWDDGKCVECAPGCSYTLQHNDECDAVCNTLSCNWDNIRCYECAPNCSYRLQHNNICNTACDSEPCNWDNGRCLFCAEGCDSTMLANGKCDPKCNVSACNFDNGACFCFYNFAYPCNFAGMHPACYFGHFGSGGCENEMVVKFALYGQIMDRNFDGNKWFFYHKYCVRTKAFEDTFMHNLNENTCFEAANSERCLYGLGLCTKKLPPNCARGYGLEEGQCFECRTPLVQFFGFCLESCPQGTSPINFSPRLCTNSTSVTTVNQQNMLYVKEDLNTQDIHDGPVYFTLPDAMAAAWELYTTIALIGEEVTYDPLIVFSRKNIDYLPHLNLPDLISDSRWRQLTIESQMCSTSLQAGCFEGRTVLHLRNLYTHTLTYKTLIFRNVILTTKRYFEFESSPYCPYFSQIGSRIYDDRNEVVEEVSPGLTLCHQFEDFPLFFVKPFATLTLQRVRIEDFTLQFNSLITIEGGKVELLDVDFEKVQMSSKGAVIRQSTTCFPLTLRCGNFTFKGGTVRYLNNGFEFTSDVTLSSFLQIADVFAIELVGLKFEYNAVARVGGLLQIRQVTSLKIIDCTFNASMLFGSLLLLDSLHPIGETKLVFKNATFSSNYSKSSLIHLSFAQSVSQILLEGCVFSNNSVSSGSILRIEGSKLASIGSSFLNITNSTFSVHSSFYSIVSVLRYQSVVFALLEFLSNKDSEVRLRETIEVYLNNSETYAKSYTPTVQKCTSMFELSNCGNSTVVNLTLIANECFLGGTGGRYRNSKGNNVILGATVKNNKGGGPSGLALDLGENAVLTVREMRASSNTHSATGVISAQSSSSLSIYDSSFEHNSGEFGAVFALDQSSIALIQDCHFHANEASSSLGGVVYLLASASHQTHLLIESCTFTRNSAQVAGGIYIGSDSLENHLHLQISNSSFTGNQAASGASLYIDEAVHLVSDCEIVECRFKGEVAAEGALTLRQLSGVLNISSSVFDDNEGNAVSAINIDSGEMAKTLVVGCLFQSNRLGPALRKSESLTRSAVETKDCKFLGNEKSVDLHNAVWNDEDSLFFESATTSVSLMNRCEVTMTRSTFQSNSSPDDAGAISIQSHSHFTCAFCTFEGNRALQRGGVMLVKEEAQVNLTHCSFLSNQARESGSAIYFHSSPTRYQEIHQTVFNDNSAIGSATIAAMNSLILLESVILASNTASKAAGIWIILTTLRTDNCTFSQQDASSAPFLLIETSSEAHIANSLFTEGKGKISGAIYITNSKLTLAISRFERNQADSGAMLYSVSSSIAILQSDILDCNSKEGIAYVERGTLRIEQSRFINFQATAVYSVLLASLEIQSTTFTNGKGDNGSAVYCSRCAEIVITMSHFERNQSYRGTVFLVTTSEIQSRALISDSFFISNIARSTGGAIFASDVSVSISRSDFRLNKAVEAGALYLACSDVSQFAISLSTFDRNSAKLAGGAIFWTKCQPVMAESVLAMNSAPYGPHIASFPASLSITIFQAGKLVSSVHNIAPGQPANVILEAALLDHYGQVVTTDSSSKGVLRTLDFNEGTVSGNSENATKNGQLRFEDFSIYGKPDSTILLQVSVVVSQGVAYSPIIEIALRACVDGESSTETICIICPKGTFSFDPSKPCQNCDPNAECLGGTTVFPKSGYWRPSQSSSRTFKCPNADACLGGKLSGEEINFSGLCAKGYESVMCQTCTEGFFSTGRNRCAECRSSGITIVHFLFEWILILALLASLEWIALSSTTGSASFSSTRLKMMLNFLQTAFLITDFEIDWPGAASGFIYFIDVNGAPLETTLPLDCVLPSSYRYFRKVLFFALLPFALIVGWLLFWTIVSKLYFSISYFKRYCLSSVVVSLFFFYPTIVRFTFSLFSCTEIESGQFWLNFETRERCWTSTHRKFLYVVGVPSVIVWVIGAPLLCFDMMLRVKPAVREQHFGFLTCGLESKKFYWELIALARKVALSASFVFFMRLPMIQVLITLLVIWIALFIQLMLRPYTKKSLNRLELQALLALLLTSYCEVLTLTNNVGSFGVWFLLVLACCALGQYLVVWTFQAIRNGFKEYMRGQELKRYRELADLLPLIRPLRRAPNFENMTSAYIQMLASKLPSSVERYQPPAAFLRKPLQPSHKIFPEVVSPRLPSTS